MNYYIKGDAAKAKQIKAAFENKGYDTTGWKCNVNDAIYYTTDERKIDLACSKFFIKLIKTHPNFKELELSVEPKFKVGDWIVNNNSGGVHQVTEIRDDEYCIWPLNAKIMGYLRIIDVDDEYHLWTIADAKDGDVIAFNDSPDANLPLRWIGIYKQPKVVSNKSYWFHCIITPDCTFRGYDSWWVSNVHPATKEQRDLLFSKMREAGYQWDSEKKELRKIIEPKFKVGDSLQSGCMWAMVKRIDTENQRYICQFDNVIPFEEQDRWNFVPNPKKHYAIANFKPFDKVLVRCKDGWNWECNLFSRYDHRLQNPFITCNSSYPQCIPFNDDTKHLLGTTDMCDEQYINW